MKARLSRARAEVSSDDAAFVMIRFSSGMADSPARPKQRKAVTELAVRAWRR